MSQAVPSVKRVGRRRVAITGLGVISPSGLTLDSFWQSLHAGRSAVSPIRKFDVSELPSRIGGEIPDEFDPKQYVDKKERKRLNQMSSVFHYAVAAARNAWIDSGLEQSKIDPTRFGVFFGASSQPGDINDLGPAARCSKIDGEHRIDLNKFGAEGIGQIPPIWLLNYIPNIAACHISVLHDAQGPSNSITQSDVAGLTALGEAYHAIAENRADLALVGASDTKMQPVLTVRFSLLYDVSRRDDNPAGACRPFDRNRDGMVLGEGAGFFLLEEWEHAKRRGARIWGEMVGFGSAFDLNRDGAGVARCMRQSLQSADASLSEIDHVIAHGLGSVPQDAWEAKGINQALEGRPIPVVAYKPYLGNIGAGSTQVEIAASLLGYRQGVIPRTLNYEHPDPECPVLVAREPRVPQRQRFLKVALNEQGQCASVVIDAVGASTETAHG